MNDTPKTVREYMAKLGRKGGKRVLETRGREFFSEIGKRGLKKRWDAYKKKTVDNSA